MHLIEFFSFFLKLKKSKFRKSQNSESLNLIFKGLNWALYSSDHNHNYIEARGAPDNKFGSVCGRIL